MTTMLLLAALLAWDPPGPPPGPSPDFPPPDPAWQRDRRQAVRPTWFDSAMTGRARKSWSGVVELELPSGRRDTAKVCGGPRGFRIDFRNGRSMWDAGDSSAFLDASSKSVRPGRMRSGHGGPPPGMPMPVRYALDTLLGRPAVVYTQRGPFGGAHRMWVDTTIPLLLRGEGPGPGARRLLSLDLSRGCPADAFTVPAGWTRALEPPPPPPRHEESSIPAVEKAVGFAIPRPSWVPPGFEPAGQSWFQGRRRPMAHLRWSDGARLISLFVHPGDRGFEDCQDQRPCRLGGPDPVVVRHGPDVSTLVTGPLDPEDLRRFSQGLR